MLILICVEVEAAEFNSAFLNIGGLSDVDLSNFSQADFTLPGSYLLDVRVNDLYYGTQSVEFVAGAESGGGKPCLNPALIAQLGFKRSIIEKMPRFHNDECADIAALEGVTIRYLKSEGVLSVTIPQAALEYADADYVPPARWSEGVDGGMLDYHVIANASRALGNGSPQDSSIQAYGTIGANWGAWRFRGDYQAQSDMGSSSYAQRNFRMNQVYAFRPLPLIQSTASFGEIYVASNIFDTISMSGASIGSDERMLPPSLRNYAPLIAGVARTSATVRVMQQGRVLYMTKVSPGPFALQNINTSVQGTLDVLVEEEDGTIQHFQVTTASVPFLAREGQLRYKAAVGQPRLYGATGITPWFGFAEAAYGLPLKFTLYGGLIAASGYTALALGIGRDFGGFGALSADVTRAHATLWWNGESRTGNSYRFNYSKHIDAFDADVRFFGYRFSERDYTTFSQFSGDPTAIGLASSKQRYSGMLSKRFGDISSYFSYDQTTYWSRPSDQRIGVTLSRAFMLGGQSVSVNLSAFHTQGYGGNGNQFSVTATLPLGQRQTMVSSVTQGTGSTDVSAGYIYDDLEGRSYQLYGGETQGRASTNASFHQRTSSYQLSAQASAVANGYVSGSLEADGSLVATRYGVAAHASGNSGDTRLLVSTDGVPDVPLADSLTHSNKFGYAVLDSISPYNVYDAMVSVEKLPLETQVTNPIQRVVLTDGAIGYVKFNTARGRNVMVTLTLPTGQFLPFGVSVQDAVNGKELGIVGERGVAYLTQIQPDSKIVVRAGSGTLCTLDAIAEQAQLESVPIPIVCRPDVGLQAVH